MTEISDSGDVTGSLALDWEQIEPTRWSFTLRPGVTFHNGALFDAHAVVTTLNFLKTPGAARYLVANELNNIVGVDAISDLRVNIVTQEPDAILPRRLSLIKIIEPRLWTELGPDGYATAPVGTGPYAFGKWGVAKSTVTLTAFENERRPVAGVRTLTLIDMPDTVSREQALVSGEIDVNGSVNADSIETLRASGFDVQVFPLSQIISITLPNVGPVPSPLKIKEVRQALNMAVDRHSIAKFVYGGLVEPASQGAIPGTVGYNPDIEPYPYDPKTARSLLANAGYQSGFPLKIGILQLPGTSLDTVYQKVVQDLGAVGVQAEIRSLLDAEFLRRLMTGEWGEYDAFSLLWSSEPLRDVGRALEYFSCLRPQPFFCDEDLAAAIKDSRTESDPQKREQDLRAIMARVHDVAPSIWLTNMTLNTATTRNVRNIKIINSAIAFEAIELQP